MDAFAVAVGKGLSMRRINWKHAGIIALYFGAFQALMPILGYLLAFSFAKYVTKYSHIIAFVILFFIGAKMIWDALHEGAESDNAEGGAEGGALVSSDNAEGGALVCSGGAEGIESGKGVAAADLASAEGAAEGSATVCSGAAEGVAVSSDNARLDHKELFLLAVATSIDALAIGISIAFSEGDIITNAYVIGTTTFIISLAGVVVGNFFGARYKKPATIAGGFVLILIGLKLLVEHL